MKDLKIKDLKEFYKITLIHGHMRSKSYYKNEGDAYDFLTSEECENDVFSTNIYEFSYFNKKGDLIDIKEGDQLFDNLINKFWG